jgi:hypothetical protein
MGVFRKRIEPEQLPIPTAARANIANRDQRLSPDKGALPDSFHTPSRWNQRDQKVGQALISLAVTILYWPDPIGQTGMP